MGEVVSVSRHVCHLSGVSVEKICSQPFRGALHTVFILSLTPTICVFLSPLGTYTQNRGNNRSGKFRDWVPLPWLALVVFQAVEFGLAAYEVETEDVDELVQR